MAESVSLFSPGVSCARASSAISQPLRPIMLPQVVLAAPSNRVRPVAAPNPKARTDFSPSFARAGSSRSGEAARPPILALQIARACAPNLGFSYLVFLLSRGLGHLPLADPIFGLAPIRMCRPESGTACAAPISARTVGRSGRDKRHPAGACE